VSDSAAQKSALSVIVGTLQRCVGFTAESRDSLARVVLSTNPKP
jgi:hypothetical protein